MDKEAEETVSYINEYAETHHSGVIECKYSNEKGRILVATRSFAPGETIFSEPCLRHIRVNENNLGFQLVKKLCDEYNFELEALWYWCALNSVVPLSIKELALSNTMGAYLQRIDTDTVKHLELLHGPSSGVAGVEVPILLKNFGLENIVDPLFVERMIQIWTHNCFDVSDEPPGFAIYFMPSFSSHSCLPNALWRLDEDGARFVLVARMTIYEGEEISLSYLGEDALLEPAFLRRKFLETTKSFVCSCVRCTASVDLCRGVSCPTCSDGVIFFHPNSGTLREPPEAPFSSVSPSTSHTKKCDINNLVPYLRALRQLQLLHIDFTKPLKELLPSCILDLLEAPKIGTDALTISQTLASLRPFVCCNCGKQIEVSDYKNLLRMEQVCLKAFYQIDKTLGFASTGNSTLELLMDGDQNLLENVDLVTWETEIEPTPPLDSKEAIHRFLSTLMSSSWRFIHHWIGYRALTYKTYLLSWEKDYAKTARRFIQRCLCIRAMFPGLSGCSAWIYQDLAIHYLVTHWNFSCKLKDTQSVLVPPDLVRMTPKAAQGFMQDATAVYFLTKAKDISTSLFGACGEYTTEIISQLHCVLVSGKPHNWVTINMPPLLKSFLHVDGFCLRFLVMR